MAAARQFHFRSADQQDTAVVRLSKSRIAAFEHCPKRLWLQIHRPGAAVVDAATLRLFATGHQIGELARARHPDGVLVTEDHRELVAAVARTRELISAKEQRPIFEAAFQHKAVVVRADILDPDGWGGWRLIEVKSSASVKPYQLLDVATQAWVLRGNNVCLSSLLVRHVERPLKRRFAPMPWIRFIDADVTLEAQQLVGSRAEVVKQARAIASGLEPEIRPGLHCTRPFRCEFRNHCARRQSLRTA